jgi:hypothetical protein
MSRLKTIFCVAAILGLSSTIHGQKLYSIKGAIADSTNQKEIPYANIALLKQSDSTMIKGTTADDKGAFAFEKITADSLLVRYSSIGFRTVFQPLVLASNQTNLGTIILPPSTSVLKGVEVTAEKPLYSFDADKKVYNVAADPSMQGGSASDALQNAPGVWVDMEGNITLRGVSGVEIWINGKPSKIKEEGLKTYLQQLPANALDRIEVMTNPSAKYGASGTGGIINIITKEKIKKNYLLSFGINGSTRPEFSPWLSYVWSNQKWSISSYLSHSQSTYKWNSNSNGIVKNNADTTYSYDNTSESNSDYSWNYGYIGAEYEINPKNSISVYAGAGFNNANINGAYTTNRFMNGENVNYNINTLSDGKSNGYNWNGGLTYEHKYNDKGKNLSLDLSSGQWQHKYTSDYQETYLVQSEKDRKRKTQQFNKS